MQVCILIPTYNNAATLKGVLDRCLEQGLPVLVVNDGSTDGTAEILAQFSDVECIVFEVNRGKGQALRAGFQRAAELGYSHAITIDSDGQHFPEDIPLFVKELDASENDQVLLIGSRDMTGETIPGKSSFGNRFSNFWYKVETGLELDDTQSGFRLYPLRTVNSMPYRTGKFEFEIEVLVRAAWAGVEVRNIPVRVLYEEDRVSHFRPIMDFARISVLNTSLVFIAFLYIKPRYMFRRVRERGIYRFFKEEILRSGDPPAKKALSIFLGIAIGLSPFWGLHTVLVLTLAVFLKLNKAIAFGFSNISLPPFIPFVIFCSAAVGSFLLGRDVPLSMEEFNWNFEAMKHLEAYIFGSFVLAISVGALGGLIGYVTLKAMERSNAAKLPQQG